MTETYKQIEHNRAWLRDMREYLGWSTTETAEHAREAASELNDDVRVSQQAVSAFENGKHKATPRWLGYAQTAMSHYLAERKMDAGRLWELHLPLSMKKFFTERRAQVQGDEWLFDNGEDDDDELLADPKSIEKVTSNLGLMPIRHLDLAFGMGATYIDNAVEEEMRFFPEGFIRSFTNAPAELIYFAEGAGDSMMPTVHSRDVVIIDASDRRITMADQIWACTYSGMGMIKRLRPMPDGGVKIMSDNPSVQPETAYDGELSLFGRVVGVARKI